MTTFLPGIDATVPVPLTIDVASEQGPIKVKFTAHYKRMTVDQIKAMSQQLIDQQDDIADDVLRDKIVRITGLKNREGDEPEFCPEMLDEMLQYFEYRSALMKGLTESSVSKAALEKN